jgi:putative SbcD/Mre11-related phosphoesterase
MMTQTQFEIEPGLVLDARRAAWIAAERTLVVSDLHLGYVWTHRHAGQLLPVTAPDDTLSRLAQLVADYAPAQLVLLGDILHGGSDVKAVREQLHELTDGIGARTRLRLVEGNHDFTLAKLLRRNASPLSMEQRVICGPHLLLHGHALGEDGPQSLLDSARARGGRVFFGHEHPAIRLSDGVASSARCPCFVVGEGALLLPSFTPWSPGSNLRGGMLSSLGKEMVPTNVVAIVAGRILPLGAAFPGQ